MVVQVPAAAAVATAAAAKGVYAVAKRYGIPVANKSLKWIKGQIEKYKNRNKVSQKAIDRLKQGTKNPSAAGRSKDIQRMQKAELKKSAADRAARIEAHANKVQQYGTSKGNK